MNEKNYNGWTNYETWLVNLWLTNEGDAAGYWEDEGRISLEYRIDQGDNLDDARANMLHEIADRIKEAVEENSPATRGLYADLMNAALSEVDWREIAESYTSEIKVYAVGWNMPGYMPDNEPALFLDFDDARSYLADEIDRIADEEDDAEQLVDEVNEWKEAGEHGLNFGSYFYWIVRS